MSTRRWAAALAAIGVIMCTATPVGADPAVPTNFRSVVVRSDPALPDGVAVEVIGGDAFLQLSVEGHTVIVADYGADDADAAPFLRFDPDGTVERNANANATATSDDRYGAITRTVEPGAAPRWEVMSTDGTAAWHDHRIHWMSPTAPRAVDEGGRVDLGGDEGTWAVPLTVDGEPVLIIGELLLEDPPSPAPWLLLALTVGLVGSAPAVRRRARATTVLGLVASVLALVAAVATWRYAPAGSGASWLPVAVTGVAATGALVAVLAPARWRLGALAATAAGLLGWAVTRWAVLTHAIVPTELPAAVDRGATALALGAGVAIAVALLWPAGVRANRLA